MIDVFLMKIHQLPLVQFHVSSNVYILDVLIHPVFSFGLTKYSDRSVKYQVAMIAPRPLMTNMSFEFFYMFQPF